MCGMPEQEKKLNGKYETEQTNKKMNSHSMDCFIIIDFFILKT